MARALTKKQKAFADEYLDTGNGTQSILKTYNTTDYKTAGVMAVENLARPNVIEYLNANADAVASNMVRLALEAKRENDQIAAGKDVLDRAGYKPVERSESRTLNVDVKITDPDAEALRLEFEEKLKAQLLA